MLVSRDGAVRDLPGSVIHEASSPATQKEEEAGDSSRNPHSGLWPLDGGFVLLLPHRAGLARSFGQTETGLTWLTVSAPKTDQGPALKAAAMPAQAPTARLGNSTVQVKLTGFAVVVMT